MVEPQTAKDARCFRHCRSRSDRTRTPSWLRALHAVRIRRNLLGPHRGYRSKYGSISMPNRPTPFRRSGSDHRGVPVRHVVIEYVLPWRLQEARIPDTSGGRTTNHTAGSQHVVWGECERKNGRRISALRDSDSAIRNPAGSVTGCAGGNCVCASGKAERRR